MMNRTRNTRDKILDAALTLFNEHGVGNVSTNHIAITAGISPGNLYYHFKNKQEIAYSLVLTRLKPAIDEVWRFTSEPTPTLDELRLAIEGHFTLFWEFRFIRDLLSLMRNDPLFAQGFRTIYQLRMVQYRAMIDRLLSAGVLQPIDDIQTLYNVVEACWVITSFWMSHLEVTNTPATPEAMRRGAEMALLMLKPYLKRNT